MLSSCNRTESPPLVQIFLRAWFLLQLESDAICMLLVVYPLWLIRKSITTWHSRRRQQLTTEMTFSRAWCLFLSAVCRGCFSRWNKLQAGFEQQNFASAPFVCLPVHYNLHLAWAMQELFNSLEHFCTAWKQTTCCQYWHHHLIVLIFCQALQTVRSKEL